MPVQVNRSCHEVSVSPILNLSSHDLDLLHTQIYTYRKYPHIKHHIHIGRTIHCAYIYIGHIYIHFINERRETVIYLYYLLRVLLLFMYYCPLIAFVAFAPAYRHQRQFPPGIVANPSANWSVTK